MRARLLFSILLACSLAMLLGLPVLSSNAQGDCRPPYPGRLLVGGEGQVRFTDGSPLNVRTEPGLIGALNGQLPAGSTFFVWEGPICADNLYWWRISTTQPSAAQGKVAAQQATGWIAEGIAGEYLVEPVQPIFDAAPFLPPDAVLAFRLADGALAYTDPALNPVPTPQTLPAEFAPLPAPLYSRLAGAIRSPDESMIAWLYDQTEVEPSFNGCEVEDGCIGRVYALVVTDADGGNPRTLWEPVIGEYYPHLRLLGWREDNGAIWLKQLPWGVASPHYLPMGGGLYEVSVPAEGSTASVLQRSTDYLGTDAVLSPDGRYLAEGSDRIVITGGTWPAWEIAMDAEVASQFTWSPGSDRLAWIEMSFQSGSFTPQAFTFRIAAPGARTVTPSATLIPLPEATALPRTGLWLSNDLLSFTYGGAIWLLDVTTGELGVWVSALDGQRAVLFSGVLPTQEGK